MKELYIYKMSRKYKFHDNDKLYFISFATVNWIDVFIREEYMKIVIDSCLYGHRDVRKRKALKFMDGVSCQAMCT